MSSTSLALSNIHKNFSGVAALTNVSLEVQKGEVHALLGENGAGKSTLMNIASGTLQPDGGEISIHGEIINNLSPKHATELGLTIVHQHPAVLPDLTIAENILISVDEKYLKGDGKSVFENIEKILIEFGLAVNLRDRVETLTVAQQHLLDLAKAFAVNPSILILDEPTAPLGQESVEILFKKIREVVSQGCSVVYITHRLAEVRELANQVTILRDGKFRGNKEVSSISDSEIMNMIVGRELAATFPVKHGVNNDETEFIKVANLNNNHFSDINLTAKRGEIIGIAGVVGNGQSQLLRAIAGLDSFNGSVEINGKHFSNKELLDKTAFMPADRHSEGLMMSLSVRENAAISALGAFSKGLFISRPRETAIVSNSLNELEVKAPSMDASVSELSGGNQQKIVMSRSLLSDPIMIIADEPTQGVDVGARAEIYRILRDASDKGIPVIVNSSDTKELEGLCDRVYVMSRGHIVEELNGKDVTEEKMVAAAINSTKLRKSQELDISSKDKSKKFSGMLKSDYLPPTVIALMISLLAVVIYSKNNLYFGGYNMNAMLGLATGLGFLAIGQTIVLLTGGLDMSVGPAAGVMLCAASFFVNDEKSVGVLLIGFLLLPIIGVLVGSANGALIRYGKFTPVAGTLTIYILLIGVGFVLRPAPGGTINATLTEALGAKLGPIPYSFIALVLVTVLFEFALRKTRWGMNLRAVGSNEESARRLGININKTIFGAYIASGIMAGFATVVFMALVGIGDPAQGTPYTIQSITAVVLGGTTLLGGRGSFLGSLLGSILMIQVLNACVFLDLSQTWQYLFQGLLIVFAAISYTVTRRSRK